MTRSARCQHDISVPSSTAGADTSPFVARTTTSESSPRKDPNYEERKVRVALRQNKTKNFKVAGSLDQMTLLGFRLYGNSDYSVSSSERPERDMFFVQAYGNLLCVAVE